jgi:hypothetical protein
MLRAENYRDKWPEVVSQTWRNPVSRVFIMQSLFPHWFCQFPCSPSRHIPIIFPPTDLITSRLSAEQFTYMDVQTLQITPGKQNIRQITTHI